MAPVPLITFYTRVYGEQYNSKLNPSDILRFHINLWLKNWEIIFKMKVLYVF